MFPNKKTKRDLLFQNTNHGNATNNVNEPVKYQPYLNDNTVQTFQLYEDKLKDLREKNIMLAKSHTQKVQQVEKYQKELARIKSELLKSEQERNQSILRVQTLESQLSMQKVMVQETLIKHQTTIKMVQEQGSKLMAVSKKMANINYDLGNRFGLNLSPLASLGSSKLDDLSILQSRLIDPVEISASKDKGSLSEQSIFEENIDENKVVEDECTISKKDIEEKKAAHNGLPKDQTNLNTKEALEVNKVKEDAVIQNETPEESSLVYTRRLRQLKRLSYKPLKGKQFFKYGKRRARKLMNP